MAAPLQYFIIILKVLALQKASFSNRRIPKTVNTLPADDKHYMLNRDN